MNFTITFFLFIVMSAVHIPGAFAAWSIGDCKEAWTSGTSTLNFHGPASLSIPADTPSGTVIYEETQGNVSATFRCETPAAFGIKSNLAVGEQPAGGYLFPIKGTGLSWQISASNGSLIEGKIPSVPPGKILPPLGPINLWYGWSSNVSKFKLEIIKTGNITGKTKLPAGIWGTIKANQMALINVAMSKEVPQEALSCVTPNILVPMGEYTPSDFNHNGQTIPIGYKIGLINCPKGIKKVNYALIATTPVIDREGGIVSINASSTAEGVGLKLMNENGLPIKLNQSYTFSDYNTAGGNFSIPLTASYVRLQSQQLVSGSADTEVTFSINYL
ncbi:fimbrial protein [Pseudomonas sp. 25 R 14]|uniref:fimbrial protein n=1 Tax=Pseudomonas sp. 25 R 14 TaxID=1844109 RepID=UPI0009F6E738|nr:fimbrial protein [Pseudomonas sp. 25 R 14]